MANVTLEINGERIQVDAESDTPILWVLRDLLNMTGTKFGCGAGASRRVRCSVLSDQY
jgi:isoquinoline 1-oxidoreductase alpha subunit